MSRRTRVLLCILVLVVGLPAWIVVSATLVGLFDRPSFLVELAVYGGLGVLWVLPLRSLFRGVARPDPNSAPRRP